MLEVLETQAATGRLALTLRQDDRLQDADQRIASVGPDTLAHALASRRPDPDPDPEWTPFPDTAPGDETLPLLIANRRELPERTRAAAEQEIQELNLQCRCVTLRR